MPRISSTLPWLVGTRTRANRVAMGGATCARSAESPHRSATGGGRATPVQLRCHAAGTGSSPAADRSEVSDPVSSSKRGRFIGEPLERQPPEFHAERLLTWLQTSCWRGQSELTFREVHAAYVEMCADEYLEPQPWNPVAAELARLIRKPGRPLKTYAGAIDPVTGDRCRIRIYKIPPLAVAEVIRFRPRWDL